MRTAAAIFLPLLFAALFADAQTPATSAQPPLPPAEVNQRIQEQVRQFVDVDPQGIVSLGARTPSEFAGFDKLKVTLDQRGQKKSFDFYVSKDGRRLLYINSFDLSTDPYQRLMSKIDLRGRPSRGASAKDAKVTLVLYDDFQCPFCAKFYVTLMNEVMQKYRDRVRIVAKDFPITDSHEWARHAAADADCLAAKNPAAYWAFADSVHTHLELFNDRYDHAAADSAPLVAGSSPRFNALDELTLGLGKKSGLDDAALRQCIAANDQIEINQSIAEGESLNMAATPGIVINGEQLEGALSTAELDAALDRALRAAR